MFSNSTLGDMWVSKWCYRCLNDENQDCPILLNIYLDKPDPHLVNPGNDQLDLVCTNFVPYAAKGEPVVDLEPVEKIPGQLEMEF
jgi:hypothetical protein